MSTKKKIIAIIQARSGSTRLPGKVLKPILDRPMIIHMLERVKRSKKLNGIVLATTDQTSDDEIAKIVKEFGVPVFRGSELDVLDRFYKAAKEEKTDIVIRLTGDCPLMDPEVIDEVITHFENSKGKIDYTSTPSNYPEGLDIEIFPFSALEKSAQNATLPSEREHVSLYIKNHPELFTCSTWKKGEADNSKMHWSVDTENDFEFVKRIFEELYPTNPNFGKDDILKFLEKHPEYLEINKGGTGYEGLAKSLKEDDEFKKYQA